MIKMVGRVLGDGETHTREGEKRSRGCKENKRKGWEKTRRWPEIEWGWGEVRGLERWEGGREWQLGEKRSVRERMWVWLTWRLLLVLKKKTTLKCMAILFKLVYIIGSFFTVSEFLLIWLLSLNNKHPNQMITLEAIQSSSSLSTVRNYTRWWSELYGKKKKKGVSKKKLPQMFHCSGSMNIFFGTNVLLFINFSFKMWNRRVLLNGAVTQCDFFIPFFI